MFETAMVLLAREPNKVELVSKRSMAVRARVSASGKRSSSAAPASANASAPFCSCVCRLISLAPSSASTDRPTITTSMIVTYGRITPLVSFQNALANCVPFLRTGQVGVIEHTPLCLMRVNWWPLRRVHGSGAYQGGGIITARLPVSHDGHLPDVRGGNDPAAVQRLKCQSGFRLPNTPSVSPFGPAVK